MYTIRKCITDLRAVCRNVVILNNGTTISLFEIGMRPEDEPFGIIKGPNRVMRRIYCLIKATSKTCQLDELKKNRDWYPYHPDPDGYSYFGSNEFILPERIMNQFISANGGIDHYETIGAWAYIRDDMLAAFCWD